MIVLESGERQPQAFHGVADEAGRLLTIRIVKRVKHRGHVVPAEVIHQGRQLSVAAPIDQPADIALITDFISEPLAPCGATRENERGIKLVRAVVDPFPQRLSARLLESCFLQRAIFENDNFPSKIIEELLMARPQSLTHDSVKTLAIVVDDPPAIA